MHVPPFQGGGGIYYGRLYRLLYRRGGPRTTQVKVTFTLDCSPAPMTPESGSPWFGQSIKYRIV
jgi:hypothetical protein